MGKKAPMWTPSKKELEKILEVDNVHELFLVGQVCIERLLEKILERKFNIPIEALDDPMIMWSQKYLILEKSGLLKGNVKKNVRLINSIRNRYAHRLKPDEKAIRLNSRLWVSNQRQRYGNIAGSGKNASGVL